MSKLSRTLAALVALLPAALAMQVTVPADPAQCASVPITWTQDSVAPYTVYIVQDGQPTTAALETIAVAQGTTLAWTADVGPPGTFLTAVVEDATGMQAFSARMTMKAGTDACALVKPGDAGTTSSAGVSASGSGTAVGMLAASTSGAASSAARTPAATLAASTGSAAHTTTRSTSHTSSSSSASASASSSGVAGRNSNSAAGHGAGLVSTVFGLGATMVFAGVVGAAVF